MHSSLRRAMVGAGVLGALVAGGATASFAASSVSGSATQSTEVADDTTTTDATTTDATTIDGQQAPPQRDPSQSSHQANGITEELLTGDTATKVTEAALAAVPGATIERVETDAEGAAYEAHIVTSDGIRQTVTFDESFTLVAIEEGPGGGARGGHGGGPRGAMNGSAPASGTDAPADGSTGTSTDSGS